MEVIDAFEHIRSLIKESSIQNPNLIQEAFLEIHQRISSIHSLKPGDYYQDHDQLLRLLNKLEEDMNRLLNHTEKIVSCLQKVRDLLSIFKG